MINSKASYDASSQTEEIQLPSIIENKSNYAQSFLFNVERFDGKNVCGWIFLKESNQKQVLLYAKYNGELKHYFASGLPREDVRSVHDVLNCGFNACLPNPRRIIDVYALIDVENTLHEVFLQSVKAEAAFGMVESFHSGVVFGWVQSHILDPSILQIAATFEGKILSSTKPSVARPDAANHFSSTNIICGFELVLPIDIFVLPDRLVQFYAIHDDQRYSLAGSIDVSTEGILGRTYEYSVTNASWQDL